jgi:hypothetical protein
MKSHDIRLEVTTIENAVIRIMRSADHKRVELQPLPNGEILCSIEKRLDSFHEISHEQFSTLIVKRHRGKPSLLQTTKQRLKPEAPRVGCYSPSADTAFIERCASYCKQSGLRFIGPCQLSTSISAHILLVEKGAMLQEVEALKDRYGLEIRQI